VAICMSRLGVWGVAQWQSASFWLKLGTAHPTAKEATCGLIPGCLSGPIPFQMCASRLSPPRR
jgi:hypothetical protein